MGLTLPPALQRIGGFAQNLAARLAVLLGVRRMADVSQITPQLWTGGAITSDADVAQLLKYGITADADMRLEFDDRSLIAGYSNLPPTPTSLKQNPTIAYLYNGVADDGQPKPVSWFADTFHWAQPLYLAGGVILCHCASGVNRGPSMTYFLMRALAKMPGDEAFALLKQKRPIVNVAYRQDADKAIAALGLDK